MFGPSSIYRCMFDLHRNRASSISSFPLVLWVLPFQVFGFFPPPTLVSKVNVIFNSVWAKCGPCCRYLVVDQSRQPWHGHQITLAAVVWLTWGNGRAKWFLIASHGDVSARSVVSKGRFRHSPRQTPRVFFSGFRSFDKASGESRD